MKATIRDQETLKTVRPLELVSYLRAQGWRQVSELDDKSALWEKPCRGHRQNEEVVLPLRQEVGDFALRVSEVLRILENVKIGLSWRSFGISKRHLATLIRVRASATQTTSGSIPLELVLNCVN